MSEGKTVVMEQSVQAAYAELKRRISGKAGGTQPDTGIKETHPPRDAPAQKTVPEPHLPAPGKKTAPVVPQSGSDEEKTPNSASENP